MLQFNFRKDGMSIPIEIKKSRAAPLGWLVLFQPVGVATAFDVKQEAIGSIRRIRASV